MLITRRVLVKEFKGSPLRIFLAQDGVIYKDQVKQVFTERDDDVEETSESQKPKGLLILVPLRLGLETLNPVYHESIKVWRSIYMYATVYNTVQ